MKGFSSLSLICSFLALFLVGFSSQQNCTLPLGQETVGPGEDTLFANIAGFFSLSQRAQYPRAVLRDQHPKAHGCVYGSLKVHTGLPAAVKGGIFAEEGKNYDVWIRFSNNDENDDVVSTARGLAMKVLQVKGTRLVQGGSSQDFLFVASASNGFMTNNASEYIDLFSKGLAFFANKPIQASTLASMRATGRESLLQGPYENQLPVRIGSSAAKLSLTRCEGSTYFAENSTLNSRTYLRQGLAVQLDPKSNHSAGCFVLGARLQLNACSHPIEDSASLWDSPVIPIATLTIPKQRFDTPSTNLFCENLSFTPWNGITEHQPLGSNMRARRVAYNSSSWNRHTLNNEPFVDPTGTPLTVTSPPTVAPSTSAPTAPTTSAPSTRAPTTAAPSGPTSPAPTSAPCTTPPPSCPCSSSSSRNVVNINFARILAGM